MNINNLIHRISILISLSILLLSPLTAQWENMPPIKHWQKVDREVRYMPDGEDFVITNGTRRFNRALYGDHDDFRVEAGDLPEFSSYLPGMGGTMKLAIISGGQGKWLIDADTVIARYRPGKMMYTIKDDLLVKGKLLLEVAPFAASNGYTVKLESTDLPEGIQLLWVYGGVSGKRFGRNGDIGADPESVFYLHPRYCTDNEFYINENNFQIYFGSDDGNNGLLSSDDLNEPSVKAKRKLSGMVPPTMNLKLSDAETLSDPVNCIQGHPGDSPILVGSMEIENNELSFFAMNMEKQAAIEKYSDIQDSVFNAELKRRDLTNRIKVNTPDKFLNNLGEAMSIAADGVYKDSVFLHGAVAWRNPLPGWRAAYIGDWLGWHDRARKHFTAYLNAQYQEPDTFSAAPDPNRNLARQIEKKGYSIFTEGYISRNPNRISSPHHYDMNLVFFDQLLWHLQWSGDLEYAKEIWPSIQRHLEWEKRSFDPNNDGLYDAYACIWASDALQYSSSGVVYSSAYNYRANKLAATIASLIGEDPSPYEQEASKILDAINQELWMPDLGWYAEYKDFLGHQRIHKYPGVWSIYHSIDSEVPDRFQAYQALRYIDNEIPKIPIEVDGFPKGYHTISTTSWMPYEWSCNNVALAEVLHTSLGNWQGNRPDEAFHLWKSALLESMYLGASPGNFQQLSFYDAFRGELYRDFSDPIGVAARTLVEGLFGIIPQALEQKIYLKPGFPIDWNYASLETPDFNVNVEHNGMTSIYEFESELNQDLHLVFQPQARYDGIESVTINGREVSWSAMEYLVGQPRIEIRSLPANSYIIEIVWKGNKINSHKNMKAIAGQELEITTENQTWLETKDPQQVFISSDLSNEKLTGNVNNKTGNKTFFIQTKQGDITWWSPVNVEVQNPLNVALKRNADGLKSHILLENNTSESYEAELVFNVHKNKYDKIITLKPAESFQLNIPDDHWIPGRNTISIKTSDWSMDTSFLYWHQTAQTELEFEMVGISDRFNDLVTNIFKNEYLSPRSPYPTLQMPIQGFGDWCSYNAQAEIDDSGLRNAAGEDGLILLPQGIPFRTVGSKGESNITYTSLWDNYPDSTEIPLSGKASHAYLLMAGSTNHMQSRFVNGVVTINYTDGSHDKLELVNPDTWWPIEQDFFEDGYAYNIETPRPPRVYLKTGETIMEPYEVLSRNHTVKINGGAASVLDIPLDPSKELRSLELETLANEVVIGLMGITLLK